MASWSSWTPPGGPIPRSWRDAWPASRDVPFAYLAFDLLHLDGRPLLSMPLERRREQLRRVLRPGDEVLAVPAIPGEGRALFEAVAAQGLAGILARQRLSPYLPGIRSRLWRFIPVGGPRPPGSPVAEAILTARRDLAPPRCWR